MTRKRTWSMVAVAATGIIGAGTALGITSANASPLKVSGDLSRQDNRLAATSTTAKDNDLRVFVAQSNAHPSALNARKAKVIKAVLRTFPHARILKIVMRRDDTWFVTVLLRDHRVGIVTVNRHFKVVAFKQLNTRDAHFAMTHPSTTIIIIAVPSTGTRTPTFTAPIPPPAGAPGTTQMQTGTHW